MAQATPATDKVELKRGRAGPAEVAAIKKLHAEGKSIADMAKELRRSEKVVNGVINGKSVSDTPKRGRPAASPSMGGGEVPFSFDFESYIRRIVREEIKRIAAGL